MNKIYIVAGERNMRLAQSEGGLWANVGQTTRNVYERLRDDDYKRKAMGGELMVLFEQDVGDMTTDKQIHPLLKNHPDVSWSPKSSNTEEFFFKGDLGDGVVARKIVSEVLQKVCLPVLLQENARLKNEINDAQEEIEKKEKIIKQITSGDMLQLAMERLLETEKECQEIKDENERLQQEQEKALFIFEQQAANTINQLQQEINSKTSDIITANTKLNDTQQKLSNTQEYYDRQIRSVYASLEKEQKALSDTREDLLSTFETLNKWKMASVLAGSLATILLSFVGWKLWESHDEINQLQSQFVRQEEALINETLKNNRLKLKLADESRPSRISSAEQGLNHKDRQATHPPTLLDPAEKKRYDELFSKLGKDRADAYAKRMAENDAATMGAARYAVQHSKPIDPDVNPDTAGVVILDAGVLVTLINEQVVSNATACLLLRSKFTSKYHVTAAMGILPDGSVGYVKVQDQTGDPQLVADCVLPALKSVKIEPPDVNMLGTYTVDFNIKVPDEQGG